MAKVNQVIADIYKMFSPQELDDLKSELDRLDIKVGSEPPGPFKHPAGSVSRSESGVNTDPERSIPTVNPKVGG